MQANRIPAPPMPEPSAVFEGGEVAAAEKLLVLLQSKDTGRVLIDGLVGTPQEIIRQVSVSDINRFLFLEQIPLANALPPISWGEHRKEWEGLLSYTGSIGTGGNAVPMELSMQLLAQQELLSRICKGPTFAFDTAKIAAIRESYKSSVER
ncbi:MAG: hypothetical protein KDB22_10435 [Planctomycetales bacterium]|nr:hypothetical protein [Planctomycetales bacterium]